MNEFFNNFQKEARTIKLSQEEKQSLRVHLYKTMEESPAYTATQKSAVEDFKSRSTAPVPSMYHWFSPRFSVPVAVLLMVGLSGGTAFAAQSALPGEPLYAVKIHVNEAVVTALATTPTAKAEVNAELATTRLEEAETLAAQGTLDATTTSALANNFAEHADAAHANARAVANEDPGVAAQLSDAFDSTLSAHGAILAQLSSDSDTDSIKTSSDSLALQVIAQTREGRQDDASSTQTTVTLALGATSSDTPASNTNEVRTLSVRADSRGARAKTFAAVAPTSASLASSSTSAPSAPAAKIVSSNNGDDGVVAVALEEEASSTLTTALTDFTKLKTSLDTNTTAQVQGQLDMLQNMFVQGAASLDAGDNGSAKDTFSRVLKMSVRLDAFLKAGKKFNGKFLSSLLNNSSITVHGRDSNAGNSNSNDQESDKQSVGTTTSSVSVEAHSEDGDSSASVKSVINSSGSSHIEIDTHN